MFEDSTFESNGRIRTRSRGWMIATLIFNGSILLALILIPLIDPETLPRQALSFLLTAPPPPPAPRSKPEQPPATRPFHGTPEMIGSTLVAPRQLPKTFTTFDGPEAPAPVTLTGIEGATGLPNGLRDAFGNRKPAAVVHPDVKAPVRVASTIVAGLLICKVTPTYPPIAVAARQEGTVVLQAKISKTGNIENLRVASGPPMLQQAAMDAVKNWAYRPYLLNGQPVEVETTVNVVFTLDR
jgi:periplasmic protein TonB